jgi:hypothetical protein
MLPWNRILTCSMSIVLHSGTTFLFLKRQTDIVQVGIIGFVYLHIVVVEIDLRSEGDRLLVKHYLRDPKQFGLGILQSHPYFNYLDAWDLSLQCLLPPVSSARTLTYLPVRF